MTSQEALAQALMDAYMDSDRPTAAAILDALPEGWVLQPTNMVYDQLAAMLRAEGAQQERERLWGAVKPLLDMLPEGYGRDPRFAAAWDAFHPDEHV
jgi:hypothetical protein